MTAVAAGILMTPAGAAQRAAPQENPADVKALVFDLANAMGMLRGLQQEDSILTLEHWAKGTMIVGQQRFEVPEYRLSINYAVFPWWTATTRSWESLRRPMWQHVLTSRKKLPKWLRKFLRPAESKMLFQS